MRSYKKYLDAALLVLLGGWLGILTYTQFLIIKTLAMHDMLLRVIVGGGN